MKGWGVHLTKHQPDPQADQMSCWCAVVPLLSTRCLYWGWGWGGANEGHMGCQGVSGMTSEKSRWVYCKVLLKTQDGLLNTADYRTWAQVNGTQVHTTLGHQIPLPGTLKGHRGWLGWGVHLTKHQPDPESDQMSCWPAVVPLLSTRCLYWGWGCSLENSRQSIEHWRQ